MASVIRELRSEHPLPLLLEVAGMSRSTYFYHIDRLRKGDKYKDIKLHLTLVFRENHGRYGYRRLTEVLQKEGIMINHKTVRKLMKEVGLKCLVRRKRYNSYKGENGKIAPDLLRRDFNAEKPLSKLVTDVTEFALFDHKIYLSPVLDLYNREIVAYDISTSPNLEMVKRMMKRVIPKLKKKNEAIILHSDQGALYQSGEYQRILQGNRIVQSMSRKGNCLDNAVIENFFGILKSELLYLQTFHSMEHFRQELNKYIKYYNQKRIKMNLEGLSPVDFR